MAPITNPLTGAQPTDQLVPQGGPQPAYNNFYNPQEYKPEPLVCSAFTYSQCTDYIPFQKRNSEHACCWFGSTFRFGRFIEAVVEQLLCINITQKQFLTKNGLLQSCSVTNVYKPVYL